MILSILTLDQEVFHFINTGLSNPIFDAVLPLLREKLVWVPVYLFIIAFLVMNFKKNGWYLVLFLFINFGIADTLSSKVIKNSVKRVRPCNDIALYHTMIKRVPCGGGYSFTSSHATNHFALSFFLITTIGFISRKVVIALLIWAGLVSFAQIYVGVHYPMDIIGGTILGIIIGKIMGMIFNKLFRLIENGELKVDNGFTNST